MTHIDITWTTIFNHPQQKRGNIIQPNDKAWNQALDEMRSEATQRSLALIEKILEHETRDGHPFPAIRAHLLLAHGDLQTVIAYYRNHNKESA